MRTVLLIFCSVAVASAQKTSPDALQILEATAQRYDDLSSFESSAIASRRLNDGMTLSIQLVFGYAGPSMTPAALSVPMIPPVTQMKFPSVFDESGKSVNTNQSLVGPSNLPSFDQIALWVASAKVLRSEVINKHLCDVVEVDYEKTSRNPHYEPTRYWIDQSNRMLWKMEFSELDVLSKAAELSRWTVLWNSWTENQPPPSWLIDAAKRMSPERKTKLTGKHAPDIKGRALDGSPFELSKLKGSIVVLDFWATWCGPCSEEMAILERLKLSLSGKEVEIWSVTEDDAAKVRSWLTKRKRTLPTALIRRDTAFRSYGVDILPQIAIIDRRGAVAYQWVGLKNEKDLRREIESLLSR